MRRLFLRLIFVVCLLVSGQVYSQEKIDHVVGLYIHQNSLRWIEHNFDNILDRNGYSATDYYHNLFNKRMEKTHFNELVANEKIQSAASSVRYYFNRFLRGIGLKRHHEFEFNAKGIDVSAEWEKFGFRILPNPDESETRDSVLVMLDIKARHIRMYVEEFRMEDHQHDFLGKMGFDGFFLEIDRSRSEPLEITVPVAVALLENGGVEIDIKEVHTNLMDVELKAGWRPPMELPRVTITVNGTPMHLRRSKVESLIKEKIPAALEGLKEMGTTFLTEKMEPMIEKLVNDRGVEGFEEINEMAPIGLPEGVSDIPYVWGVKVGGIGFEGQNLHATLDGWIADPRLESDLDLVEEHMASDEPQLSSFRGETYDAALTLNQGFINRILQFSTKRGYFRNLDANGETLKLTKQPVFKLKNRGPTTNKPAALRIRTKYRLGGWKKMFVKNPMQIEMDLNIDMKVENGQAKMVVSGIDTNSMLIENKYIKWPWRKIVRKQAKKMLRDMAKDVAGYVLADNLPIPTELGGIPFRITKTKIDSNGHLIIFMDVGV